MKSFIAARPFYTRVCVELKGEFDTEPRERLKTYLNLLMSYVLLGSYTSSAIVVAVWKGTSRTDPFGHRARRM